jgi:hypothetical protein
VKYPFTEHLVGESRLKRGTPSARRLVSHKLFATKFVPLVRSDSPDRILPRSFAHYTHVNRSGSAGLGGDLS